MLLAQLLADCAKHEQEMHLQLAVDAAEAAGEVVEAEDGREGAYGTMHAKYESLDEVRAILSRLTDETLERWEIISQPGGEWDAAGCECTRATLAELFASDFQPAAVGNCGSPQFAQMIMWVLTSASATCR
jgi:hypothetical protein